MNAKVKLLYPDSKMPTKGSPDSAGFDCYARINNEYKFLMIGPKQHIKIGLGIAVTPPKGHFAAMFARSGLSTSRGLRPTNCVGVCDYDYTGEYMVGLYNDSDMVQMVKDGERIVQIVFIPYEDATLEEVAELSPTSRQNGGFGSTGV